MLTEKFSRRRRVQQVSEFSQTFVESLFHFCFKLAAEPTAQRGSESALLPPANLTRNPGRDRIPQKRFAHARPKVVLERQARNDLNMVRISARRAAFTPSLQHC